MEVNKLEGAWWIGGKIVTIFRQPEGTFKDFLIGMAMIASIPFSVFLFFMLPNSDWVKPDPQPVIYSDISEARKEGIENASNLRIFYVHDRMTPEYVKEYTRAYSSTIKGKKFNSVAFIYSGEKYDNVSVENFFHSYKNGDNKTTFILTHDSFGVRKVDSADVILSPE